jgi:hypothetical protein
MGVESLLLMIYGISLVLIVPCRLKLSVLVTFEYSVQFRINTNLMYTF